MSSMEDMYTDFRASRVSSAHYITVIISFRIYLSNRSFVYLLIVFPFVFLFVSTVASYSCTIYIFYTFGTHPATLSRMQLTEWDYLDRTLSHYHFDRIPVHHKSSVHLIRRLAAQLT